MFSALLKNHPLAKAAIAQHKAAEAVLDSLSKGLSQEESISLYEALERATKRVEIEALSAGVNL